MRILGVAAAFILVLGLGSCATLSEDQCLTGDWRGIGRADGAAGAQMSRLEDHNKACAKHGVVPDAVAYARGRDEGLIAYCTPPRGFEEGRMGRGYGGVCPAGRERGFLVGFADGGLVHATFKRLEQAQSERRSARTKAEDYERQIREEEDRLADPALQAPQREAIRTKLKRLREDRDRARDDERRAERRERDAERETEDIRARFIPVYGPF